MNNNINRLIRPSLKARDPQDVDDDERDEWWDSYEESEARAEETQEKLYAAQEKLETS